MPTGSVVVVMHLPSGEERLSPFSYVWDSEHPEDYVYDPEITNRWYWEQQGNETN